MRLDDNRRPAVTNATCEAVQTNENNGFASFAFLIFNSKMIQSHADLSQAASVGGIEFMFRAARLCANTLAAVFSTIKQELCHASLLITGPFFFRGLG